jgi:hypothetical protein
MFEQQDYILRVIALAGAALRRALEQLRVGRAPEALESTEDAIGKVLDTDPDLILRLAPDGLATYLLIGAFNDERRLSLLARAFEARAQSLDVMQRPDEAELDRQRAAAIRGLITQAPSDDS